MWMMPTLPSICGAMPRTLGKPRLWSPPQMIGKDAGSVDVGNRLGDLIEGLFDVAGNDENIAGIAQIQFLVRVDAAIKPIAVIESRDAPNRLRSEAGPGPVSRG